MSGGVACICEGHSQAKQSNWVITQYKQNRSAFNGYHPTPSDYSEVRCKVCQGVWRTKARYVDDLPLQE